MIAAPAHSYADDRNGNFPSDILAVGNSYVFASIQKFSEQSRFSYNNNPGRFDKKYTSEAVTIRRGVFENVDIAVSGIYFSDYTTKRAIFNGPSATAHTLEGWGNPAFNISYGLINDKKNPFSLKLSVSASPNTSGNSSGYISPYMTFGYKLNDVSRLHARAALDYAMDANYANAQGVRFGGQYDFNSFFTFEMNAEFKNINSVGMSKSYYINSFGFDVIYKAADNFYIAPSFTNGWRSALTSKDNVASYKASSELRSYALAVKYLF